jgi:hypothetical protein
MGQVLPSWGAPWLLTVECMPEIGVIESIIQSLPRNHQKRILLPGYFAI